MTKPAPKPDDRAMLAKADQWRRVTIELVAQLHKAVSLLLKEKSQIEARYTILRKENEDLKRLYRSALLRESNQNTADGFLSHYVISLKLGSRLTSILRNYEIFYIGDLVTITEAEMCRMPSLGKQSLRQIKQALDIRCLHLGMDVPDWQRPGFAPHDGPAEGDTP